MEFSLVHNHPEGGFDKDNNFHYIPVKNLNGMTELFRQKVIHFLVKKRLLNESFARNLLKYNEYWKENVKLFTATDFIADLTQHLPPKRKHMIRYYGLYSSRVKGKSRENGRYEKFGSGENEKASSVIDTDIAPGQDTLSTVKTKYMQKKPGY